MSASFKSTIACKACVSAGKTENIMHLLKNSQGAVVCPMLLEQSCEWCVQNGYTGKSVKGHTPKYCDRKKAFDATEEKSRKLNEKAQRILEFQEKTKRELEMKNEKTKKPASANLFDALNWSSDEESSKKKKSKKSKKEKFAAPIPEPEPVKIVIEEKVEVKPPAKTNYLDAVKAVQTQQQVKPKKMTSIPVKKPVTAPAVVQEEYPLLPRIAGEKSASIKAEPVSELEEDKQEIGEKIYYKIRSATCEDTGKIVGMLLETGSVAYLTALYEDEQELMNKVSEALALLKNV